MAIFFKHLEVDYILFDPSTIKKPEDSTTAFKEPDVVTSKAKFEKDNKMLDIPLEELISHIKIDEANRLKDKALVTSNKFPLKVNFVESGSSSKFSRNKDVGRSKKATKFQNKKAITFKKPRKNNKSNNHVKCYVCGKDGLKAYQCYQRSNL
ncbi:hypothetical protein GOBAR_AA31746 [Gossypium barbadense]|uniref:Uncharacterized protein n=1 Tax=Gossypium barbadense TaxID=3634 RepID=A0A2P5WCX9_GOSBA|nr:hypothetical protein GOBAR_AA31746 [Gossypium barbadense]